MLLEYIYQTKKKQIKKNGLNIKKTIIKHDKTITDKLRSKLRKWNNKVQLFKYNENSRIIQRFIRQKLAKLFYDEN